jgi:hypothetical protein
VGAVVFPAAPTVAGVAATARIMDPPSIRIADVIVVSCAIVFTARRRCRGADTRDCEGITFCRIGRKWIGCV